MELKDFVKKSIAEIFEGVLEAQKEQDIEVSRQYQPVNFDVSVTTSSEGESKAGAGIFVAPFSLGASNKENNSNTSVSRIQFQVELAFCKVDKNPSSIF